MIRHYYPGVLHVARELFEELRDYSGSAAFRDVLAPWAEKRGQMIVEAAGLDPELKSVIRDIIRNRHSSPEATARLRERDDVSPWRYRVTLPRHRD